MTGIGRRALLQGVSALSAATASGLLLAACGGQQLPGLPPRGSQTVSERGRRPRMVVVYFSRPVKTIGAVDAVTWRSATRRLSPSGLPNSSTSKPSESRPRTGIRTRTTRPWSATGKQQSNARPEIAGGAPDLSGYDVIILGSPVWNTRAPMIMQTLLDAADLAGKTIHPFTTHAVGAGSVFADYANLYPDANVADGLAVQGEEAAAAGPDIERWVADNDLANG